MIVSGNIGNNIELRYSAAGKCVGAFSLPVKSGWGDNEKTSWVRCKLFGDRAEKLGPYLTKGVKVTVTGAFMLEEWEKNGVKHSMPCILVNDVDLPPKTENSMRPEPKLSTKPLTEEQLKDLDDQIPF